MPPTILNPAAVREPLVFTSVIEVFPNCIVLDVVTDAVAPIAIAFDKLFDAASALLPKKTLSDPVVFVYPAS